MSSDPNAEPRLVFLFSGHMVDRIDRSVARFPAAQEGAVGVHLFEILESLGAGPEDRGICGGAAGGDLLFAEACLGRGARVDLLLPEPEEAFVASSVDPSGTGWRQRFDGVVAADRTRVEIMGENYLADGDLGLYSRHARWLMARAVAWGPEKLHLLALWDGEPGDGSGGTADVVDAARFHTDSIHIISPDGN